MNPIYINGVGVITKCAQTEEELVEASVKRMEDFVAEGKCEFKLAVPSSKVRRCSRYTKMAVSAAALAVKDCENTDPEHTGTIITTGYGAVESNISFADSVVNGDPELCSPSVFSATVPNSCVGQICIVNGFRGFSTILTAGDPLEYSALLLHTGRAGNILCGAVEEYNEELTAALRQGEILKHTPISEGSAMLLLSAEKKSDSYCMVTGFASGSFSKYPYLHEVEKEYAEDIITGTLLELSHDKKIDLVLTQRNGTYLDEVETKAFKKAFGDKTLLINPKDIFGETLGCGYLLNVAFGAVLLKAARYPSALTNEEAVETEVRTILVTGMDAHGNYLAVLLEK